MTKIFSPCNIEVLLYYHTKGFNPHPRIDASAVRDAIQEFANMGCITALGPPDCYKTTPKGKAWVEALCNVECPRMAFVDSNGMVLGYEGEER